jgi:hypothetical protein
MRKKMKKEERKTIATKYKKRKMREAKETLTEAIATARVFVH